VIPSTPKLWEGCPVEVAVRALQVQTFVDEVWNGAHYEAAADLYGEDYVNGLGTGPSAKSEVIRRYRQTFPDLRMEIDELLVAGEGDTVVLRATFRGTDTGGYVGRAPTGRRVEEWAVTVMHFENDRVVREWVGADKLGLFIQLGALESPWPD
jgi:predicted ester cyclase